MRQEKRRLPAFWLNPLKQVSPLSRSAPAKTLEQFFRDVAAVFSQLLQHGFMQYLIA